MKNKKIIFLDIDWVLNKYSSDDLNIDFDNTLINNLKKIIKETWALIVISSDWKYDMIELFQKWPISLPMYIDSTEKMYKEKWTLEEIRVKEIKNWLEYYHSMKYNIKYIVLDDMKLDIENFIQVDNHTWLTIKNTNDAIDKLNA